MDIGNSRAAVCPIADQPKGLGQKATIVEVTALVNSKRGAMRKEAATAKADANRKRQKVTGQYRECKVGHLVRYLYDQGALVGSVDRANQMTRKKTLLLRPALWWTTGRRLKHTKASSTSKDQRSLLPMRSLAFRPLSFRQWAL